MLNFTYTMPVPLEKDLSAFRARLYKKFPSALKVIGEQMCIALAESAEKIVYDAYTPKRYPRRGDNPRFGKGIADQALDVHPEVSGNKLTFTYNPYGTHEGFMSDMKGYWDIPSGKRPKPGLLIKPYPVYGDDLIRRLETGKGYDWKVKIPPRPFWTDFVQKQRDDHIINYFMYAMRPYEVIGDGNDVVFDGSEYVPGTQTTLNV